MADYFNYGFNEATWSKYCEKQRSLRVEFGQPKRISVRSTFTAINVRSMKEEDRDRDRDKDKEGNSATTTIRIHIHINLPIMRMPGQIKTARRRCT